MNIEFQAIDINDAKLGINIAVWFATKDPIQQLNVRIQAQFST